MRTLILLTVLLLTACSSRAQGPRMIASPVMPDSTCQRYGVVASDDGGPAPLWLCPSGAERSGGTKPLQRPPVRSEVAPEAGGESDRSGPSALSS